ncbi:MAG: tetratricopeptide repeat protein, partial [Caldilineaceae bacterium]|nr:tetratricopeptide repeat protein [Caldilineaceae bacterium]
KAAAEGLNEKDRDLIGRIAAIRATVAAGLQQVDAMIAESQRALANLLPDNLAFRTSTNWKLGYAYHLNGDFAAAKAAYQDAIVRSQATGNTIFAIMSHIGLADIYQIEAQLLLAAEHYQSALDLSGEQPLPSVGEAHSGLAQIYYEWNDLDTARRHAEQGLHLGRQWERSDSPIRNEWMLARVQLASGDIAGATAQLAKIVAFMQQFHFTRHLDDVVTTQVLTMLAQNAIAHAAALVQEHPSPLSRARVALAQGDIQTALTVVAAARQEMVAQGRQDKTLRTMALQATVLAAANRREEAVQLLGETLALAEPGGWIRLFVDEGPSLAGLLTQLAPQAALYGVTPAYIATLLAAFPTGDERDVGKADTPPTAPMTVSPIVDQPLPEPLSDREIEVLQLIAAGHKNQEIADELFVSLNTVRYHTKNLYGKLGVNKRTQAVAKAQELRLI